MQKINSDRTNEIKSGVSTNKDIELAIQERENKSQLDKKSSTKSSEKAGNKNIVRPYILEEKRKINNTINPFALKSNTQDITENTIFNESDRKKLILTNDVSEIENKSELFNLVNLENINNKASELKDFNNQSFGNHEFYLKQHNSNKNDKENEFFDDSTLKSRKDKNLLQAFNKINYPKDNKAKNNNIKSNSKNGEEVVLDMDILENKGSEKKDKRYQKIIKLDENNNKIINEKSNMIISSYPENKDHANNYDKQIKNDFQEKSKQEYEKTRNKETYILEIKEETYLDDENKKKFYCENSQIFLKEDLNNSDLKETLEFQTKISIGGIKSSNENFKEKKELVEKIIIGRLL